MTRIVALRASIIFVALTVGAISLTSHAALLTALLLISGSVAALLIVLAAAPAELAPVPVRVGRRGAR